MRKKFFIRLTVLIGIAISISACGELGKDRDNTFWKKAFKENGVSPSSTTLTANTWTDVNFTKNKYEWFKFTATAETQYIHFIFGTWNSSYNSSVYVKVYDSNGTSIRVKYNTYKDYFSLTVKVGQEYYIQVWHYTSDQSGTYQIAFNFLPCPPVTTITPLNENIWADGNLSTSSDIQWFKFTATANAQYIHFIFGTLDYSYYYNSVYVKVYDSNGNEVIDENISRDGSFFMTVTAGQNYYISVSLPDNSSRYGTYQIAFSKYSTTPSITITLPSQTIPLISNTWADGNIPTSSDLQWFKFTATAETQYIHASFGTLDHLYVWVYNSSGTAIGRETDVLFYYNHNYEYIFLTLEVGQEYYIRVRPYYSSRYGTYQIAFNTSKTAP